MDRLLDGISPTEIRNGLIRARDMISDPAHWQQHGYRKFDRRCTAQALAESANEEFGELAHSPLFQGMSHRLLAHTGRFSIDALNVMEDLRDQVCNFNDDNDHKTLMKVFDKAIA